MLPKSYNKQEFQTYPPARRPYQYKEIDVSVFDDLFEGKLIEDIPNANANSPTIAPSKTFGKCKYKYVRERDFFRNYKKTVSQLILYWETVWLVGKVSAGRCAGWE
jgi:hypothetical protein